MFVSVLDNKQSFSMQVRDAASTSNDSWRNVFGKEAASINPLAAVNVGRNNLILDAMKTDDWSNYNNFQAKQHPAWYDKIDGEFKPNKMYYGNLIDSRSRSLTEAKQSGDDVETTKRQAYLDETIKDFKNAPGEIPHVIAFITNPELAGKHGIGKPTNDWYNSPYNNALAGSQGKFADQLWHENPYFIENPKELAFALESVQQYRPEIANSAAIINKGAYERNAASSSFTQTTAQSIIDKTIGEAEKEMGASVAASAIVPIVGGSFALQAAQLAHQFGVPTLVEQLFKDKEIVEKNAGQDFLLEQLLRNGEVRKHQVV